MNPDRTIHIPKRPPSAGSAEDALGLRFAVRLDACAADLPHDVTERLRASRTRAVAARKRTALPARKLPTAHRAPNESPGWFARLVSAMPALALVLGMSVLHNLSDESRANEVAEVDSALLLDALPPGAYSDAGFAQYLRLESDAAE